MTSLRINESCAATVERSLFKSAWNSFVKYWITAGRGVGVVPTCAPAPGL